MNTSNKCFTVAIVAVMSLAVLAGCSGTSVQTTQTPIVTESGASTKQWASKIIDAKTGFLDWQAEWDAGTCDVSLATDMPCWFETSFGASAIQIANIQIGGLSDENGGLYMGKIPSEIEGLYNETLAALQSADTAGKLWNESCDFTKPAEECFTLQFDFIRATDIVKSKFAAWAPYS
jgi:hypothetical protein